MPLETGSRLRLSGGGLCRKLAALIVLPAELESAISWGYVEANSSAMSNVIAIETDHEDAFFCAMRNYNSGYLAAVVENPWNGHAHAVWVLAESVTCTEYALCKLLSCPVVTEGLRRTDGPEPCPRGLDNEPESVPVG